MLSRYILWLLNYLHLCMIIKCTTPDYKMGTSITNIIHMINSPTMVHKTMIYLLILLSFGSVHNEIEAFVFMGRHKINVYNELGQVIRVHCASKNDDMGIHVLSSNQVFSWKFRVNFWETTLFFCRFWWGNKTRSFDVFKAAWDADDDYHHTYSYVVKSDGFYLSYDEPPSADLTRVRGWDDNFNWLMDFFFSFRYIFNEFLIIRLSCIVNKDFDIMYQHLSNWRRLVQFAVFNYLFLVIYKIICGVM